ncbi:MAG: NAD(P)H-dependent oxidoreductase [Paracoccaceae bacterium]
MTSPRIAIIVGSTRETRFADIPAKWILDQANARGDVTAELVDLRDFPLPMFEEVASNAWAPSQNEVAVAWQKKIAEYDGYIFIVAEYNHSITGVLKNALDQAYVEWNRKAFGVVGYGGVGAARAVEHLRNIGAELQMASTRTGVHIAGGDFMKVHPGFGGSGNLADIETSIGDSAVNMLDELVWWTNATKTARAAG